MTKPMGSNIHSQDQDNQKIATDWLLGFDTKNAIAKEHKLNSKALNQQQAEQQFIHALLINHYESKQQSVNAQELRIARVLKAIEQTDTPGQTQAQPTKNSMIQLMHFRRIHRHWMGIAASICILALTLTFGWLPANQAMAEMHAIIHHLENLGDRQYLISVDKSAGPEFKHVKRTSTKQKNADTWLNGAHLYIRGSGQYLLQAKREKGSFLRGRNQQISWVINHQNEIKLYPDNHKIKLPIASDAVSLAFMDLPTLLNRLTKNYQLSYQSKVQTSSGSGKTLSQVIANKASPQQKGVKQISILYQTESYQIEQITFHQVHMQGQPTKYQISLKLIGTADLSPDFFSPEFHLAQ